MKNFIKGGFIISKKESFLNEKEKKTFIQNGFGIESNIELISCSNNENLLVYLPQLKEAQLIKEGNYSIKCKLSLSEENNADKIRFMYGDDFIKDFSIPIKIQKDIIINLVISVDNLNNHLRLINISDDQLVIQSKIGGYYMDASYIAATSPSVPIEFTSIENKNNKTITVILNQPFTGNEDFEVFETDNPLTEVDILVTDDSVNPADNKKVVVADNKFLTGISYTLKITKDTEVISSTFTIDTNLPKPSSANVEIIGNRILNVQFNIPIQNLDAITLNDTLANFYLLYYNLDSDASLNEQPNWLGLLSASIDDPSAVVDPGKDLTVRKSADYRSLEMQMNYRGLPIGSSSLIIDYSKAQNPDPDTYLHDFSDDKVVVPTMKNDFSVLEDTVTAKAIGVIALDRTNLVVTFDKAVTKRFSEKNVISIDGIPVAVDKVLRVGNQFKELQFVLTNPLPIGLVDVTVGRITDANGYLTVEELFPDVPVVATPPRILDVDQYNDSQSQLSVLFSKDMKNTDGIGGVRNPDYYSISKLDGTFIKPIAPILYNDVTRVAILQLPETLLEGAHTLLAQDIEDSFGLAMLPQSVPFQIINTTVPDIESVTFRTLTVDPNSQTSVVVKYDQQMANSGDHAINNIENYLIKDSMLPLDTTSFIMNDSKWVRITLQENGTLLPLSDGNPDPYSIMNVGYPKVKDIRYVENIVGNIYPLCKLQSIIGPVEELDISNGVVTVLSTEVLEYKYSGDNEFLNVNINDFVIESDASTPSPVVITPLSLQLIDTKTIHFTFPLNTFDGGSVDIKVSTKAAEMLSTDIYGFKILPDKATTPPAINGLSASILGISLTKNFSSPGILRMTFNKPISHFEKDDFMCVLNDSSVVPISSATLVENTDNKSFQLEIGLSQALTMLDVVEIRLAVPENLIRTVDFNGNKIAPFTPIEVIRFIAEQPILWNKPAGSMLANSIIELDFNMPIDPGSLIPDDKFDGSGEAWDGTSPLDVPDGKILFQDNGSNLELSMPDNLSFGTIVIEDLNISGSEDNSAIAKLSLINGTKVTLEFVEEEALSISGLDGKNISYTPYMDPANGNTVKDETNVYFLYEDYKPTGIISNE